MRSSPCTIYSFCTKILDRKTTVRDNSGEGTEESSTLLLRGTAFVLYVRALGLGRRLQNSHCGIVAADAAYSAASDRPSAAQQDSLAVLGSNTPSMCWRLERGVVLSKGPRQRPVKDVTAGHVEGSLDVERSLSLDARATVGVCQQHVLDWFGEYRVQRVDYGFLQSRALFVIILSRDQSVRYVEAEDG
jgi:hypothetical protein